MLDFKCTEYASTGSKPKALARQEARELLRALTDFVNLSDTPESITFFRKRWPNFFPESLYDAAHQSPVEFPGRAFSECRKKLAAIWRGDRAQDWALTALLDIAFNIRFDVNAMGNERNEPYARLSVDWKTGLFQYRSDVRFHQALWLLLRQSWRAKVCAHCSACFLARRSAQRYCCTDCSELAQRDLKRRWWRKHGNAWRAERDARPAGVKRRTQRSRLRRSIPGVTPAKPSQ